MLHKAEKVVIFTLALFLSFAVMAGKINMVRATESVKPQVAAGESHTLYLTVTKSVWAWGQNNFGQLGDGTVFDRTTPHQVERLTALDIVAVDVGKAHSIALTAEGRIWSWGFNGQGQLGIGGTTDKKIPSQVFSINKVIAVAAGDYHTLALREDGTVWAWGSNDFGQLGNGTTTSRHSPSRVLILEDIIAVAAHGSHSLALDEAGTIWSWGDNRGGQLGDGIIMVKTPLPLPEIGVGTEKPVAISAGRLHVLALLQDGTVWTWGGRSLFQEEEIVGSGISPVKVAGLYDVKDISAGSMHNLVVKKDGTLWAWGWNGFGQLGDGTTEERAIPIPVIGFEQVESFSAGASFSIALRGDGSLWAWGRNTFGQLGEGTLETRLSPNQVSLVFVNGVALNKRRMTLEVGEKEDLIATVLPLNATNREVTWRSSRTSVAKVDSKGRVRAISPGRATITVRTKDGNFTASSVITVIRAVTRVSLNRSILTLYIDEEEVLKATISPWNASNKNIVWRSSNPSVVTVDSEGKVRALSPGKAVITVKTEDGDFTASCDIVARLEDKEWRQLQERKDQPAGKAWTVSFNISLLEETVTAENIYVLDRWGREVATELHLIAPANKEVIINPKRNYFSGRTYYLCISRNIRATNGCFLEEGLKMRFTIR